MGTTTRTMLAVVTAAALLTGCAGSGGDGGEGGTASASSSATASADASGGTAEESGEDSELDAAAREAGVDPDDPPEPIASVTMPAGGVTDEKTEARLDLLGLKRDGELLVLTVGFTPTKGDDHIFDAWNGTGGWSPQIVDGENLTVHDVAQHEDTNQAISSNTGPGSPSVGGGQTLYLYAVFGAPPQDVETVTVKLADGAPAITDVTIQ